MKNGFSGHKKTPIYIRRGFLKIGDIYLVKSILRVAENSPALI